MLRLTRGVLTPRRFDRRRPRRDKRALRLDDHRWMINALIPYRDSARGRERNGNLGHARFARKQRHSRSKKIYRQALPAKNSLPTPGPANLEDISCGMRAIQVDLGTCCDRQVAAPTWAVGRKIRRHKGVVCVFEHLPRYTGCPWRHCISVLRKGGL
jgi:hypothetical protein